MYTEQCIKYVVEKKVICNGESQNTGHPKIYLNMGEKNEITCPYCGSKFMLKKTS